ncbi:hypothetical protein [Geitlerinema sp. PCC 9228]|uniref:hypothetical protein n=1 Tax=Geitlerinema sp. PCC 9228 TaxID=111611 RepID=UPI001114F3B5|nr:hypothetical protein [Geitlerinema sp. PCC 9228]
MAAMVSDLSLFLAGKRTNQFKIFKKKPIFGRLFVVCLKKQVSWLWLCRLAALAVALAKRFAILGKFLWNGTDKEKSNFARHYVKFILTQAI